MELLIDKLVKERDELKSLMAHGRNTGQDKGDWYEGLEGDLKKLEDDINDILEDYGY